MGQYFVLVNLDKKERVEPYPIGCGAKLWEWCANDGPKLIPFLLRRSNEGGGGDDHDRDQHKYCGHWAGDRIVLVGDYDESKLYREAYDNYKDITIQARDEFNDFIGEDLHLSDW